MIDGLAVASNRTWRLGPSDENRFRLGGRRWDMVARASIRSRNGSRPARCRFARHGCRCFRRVGARDLQMALFFVRFDGWREICEASVELLFGRTGS